MLRTAERGGRSMARLSTTFRARAALHGLVPARHRALFLVCAALATAAAGSAILSMDATNPASLKVFASYWVSGQAASRGLDPYAPTPETTVFYFGDISLPELNLNPPLLLPLFQLLALLEVSTAARLLGIASTLAFLGTAGALSCCAAGLQKRQVVWLFAMPAFLDTVSLGQVYVGLLVLSAVAWIRLRSGRSTAAGVAIGALVAVKPVFLLWPVVLWLAGHRRPAAVAGATAAALTAVALLAYGPDVSLRWIAALAADRHALLPVDASLGGYLTRLGQPRLGLAAGGAVALAVAAWSWHRRPGVLDASAVALAASILAAPLAWFHYTLVLVPALLARPWGVLPSAAALLLCIPMAVALSALDHTGWAAAGLGAIDMAAVALILVGFLASAEGDAGGGVPPGA